MKQVHKIDRSEVVHRFAMPSGCAGHPEFTMPVVETVDELISLQDGVVSRRQAVARGLTDTEIARKLRRREWVRVHEGVYVDHTGEPTWHQRAWAAVLYAWPAALSHDSALRAADGAGSREQGTSLIHVAVAHDRKVKEPPGVRIHRRTDLDDQVQWNRSPPRMRYEEAVLDVAATAPDELACVALLAKSVQSRRTTARRMANSLAHRRRIARRRWMRDVLADVAEGTASVLELGYLRSVERAHGLPRACRQGKAHGRVGRIYRDTSYTHDLEIELDGRLHHDSAEGRDRDYDRDLLTLVAGRITARISYGQVFRRPCWTAAQIARLLRERGWTGSPRPCGPGCRLNGVFREAG